MVELPIYRLNLLRAGYVLLIVGLGLAIWPSILDPAKNWELNRSVIVSMLGALSLLALLGIRHPLRMLPLLFWEITWKTIWLLRVALPEWRHDGLDVAATQTAIECLMAIFFVAVIPWDYVFQAYVKAPADLWRRPRDGLAVDPKPSAAA
jgi:hypothetical protein